MSYYVHGRWASYSPWVLRKRQLKHTVDRAYGKQAYTCSESRLVSECLQNQYFAQKQRQVDSDLLGCIQPWKYAGGRDFGLVSCHVHLVQLGSKSSYSLPEQCIRELYT